MLNALALELPALVHADATGRIIAIVAEAERQERERCISYIETNYSDEPMMLEFVEALRASGPRGPR